MNIVTLVVICDIIVLCIIAACAIYAIKTDNCPAALGWFVALIMAGLAAILGLDNIPVSLIK